MVNRREFLAAAVATSAAARTGGAQERPGAALNGQISPGLGDVNPLLPVPSQNIKAGGEIGRRIEMTLDHNLLALDVEKDFLEPLRKREWEHGYIGLGGLIDASVRLSVYTNDPRIVALKNRLIAEAINSQESDGYIGYLKAGHRVWGLWDFQECAYIVYGLAQNYRFYPDDASLSSAKRLADYLIAGWNSSPQKVFGSGDLSVQLALGGVDNSLLALFEATNDSKYFDFLHEIRNVAGWDDRIILGRWGKLEGHAFTYLAQSLAMLKLDQIQVNPQLLKPSANLMGFLRQGNGMAITGACGDNECWHSTQEGTMNLGETCASVYAIFWLDELMRREGAGIHGDLMERVIYNTLFAAQSLDGRQLRYFTGLDGPRRYFTKDTYCCPNNFRRGIAALPDHIYYRSNDGVVVNLYTSSHAGITLPSGSALRLEQLTEYPTNGTVTIHVDPARPEAFSISLRIPRWCSGARASVSGIEIPSNVNPGGFMVIRREWKPGDRIELELPMRPRWINGRVAQQGHVALMHGPQVFCLNWARHPELKDVDLRLLVIDPQSLEGPFNDESVRPGGIGFRVKAWKPGSWYPTEQVSYALTLTEFPDPGGEATFFKAPNPLDPAFVRDELLAPAG
jgi:uncharacterized protein